LADSQLTGGLARLRANVKAAGRAIEERVDATMVEVAAEGEAYMKERAPWHDDTGAARAALNAVPDLEGRRKTITFTNEVDYGFVLETREHGRFGIVLPAAIAMGERLMQRFEGALDEIDERGH